MRRTPCTAAAPGAALVIAVTALALAIEHSTILIPLLVIGPLFASIRSAPACTGGVAVLAVACALPLAAIDDEFMSAGHLVETVAVAAGGALAFLVAAGRQRFETALVNERAARVRSDLIARVGRLLEAPPEPEPMLDQIVRLPVPELADISVVDLVEDGELGATWVHTLDETRAELLRDSRQRYPLDAGGPHPVAIVARTGAPHLQREIGPDQLRSFAVDANHLSELMRPGYGTSLAVPLVARGRTIGVLSFMRFGGGVPYTDADAEIAGEVARRAALALDNARLFSELRRTEAQLEAVLGNLASGVTVQAPDASLVYVNQVGAEMLGCASPDEVLSTPIPRLLERFVMLDERGQPLDLANLPGRRALAGEEPPPTVINSIVRATGAARWVVTRATAVRDEHGEIILAVNITEDVTEARLVERQQRFLSAASKLVSSSLDIDVTLDKVAWAAVPELADWCYVEMPDERGGVRRVAEAGAERRDEPALVVPMTAGDQVIGHIVLGTTDSARRLGDEERVLAEELGRRAGIAVENARLHAVRSHIATTLQRSLLPPQLPIVAGVTVAARFRAAGTTNEVGGDFYDLFRSRDGWMVVVGDVTGKGPAAAAITSLARYTMRTAAMYEHSPSALLGRLNDALGVDPERRPLCTAACARIGPRPDGTLSAIVALGGHPAPLLLAADGVRPIGTSGPLLGAFDEAAWDESEVLAQPGDAIVFFTDGVTDTRGEGGELFGQDRLEELLAGARDLEAEEIATRIDGALQAFERGVQRDDVALLVLRVGRPDAASLLAAAARARGLAP